MHIGIDGRELGGHATGVGRFLQRLLREWNLSPEGRRHRYSVYSPDGRTALPPDFPGEVALVPGAGGTRWEQQSLANAVRRDRPDIFFAPGYGAPLRTNVPFVVAIHDVSFLAHPEWFGWREGIRRRTLARWSAARAARVITISQFSQTEIVRHLHLPADRVQVVRLGIDPPLTPPVSPRESLVLFVGTIFNRRNVPLLLEAFSRVAAAHPHARLDIVGNDRTHPPERIAHLASASPARDRVRLQSWVSDEDLDDLYASASVFVFLSEYEGFGLTPLEALAAGVPSVVLDTPVAREVLGDAAVFVDRPDPNAVAEAIAELLNPSSDVRRRVLAAAPALLAQYRWPEAAATVLTVLEEAARS
jgi:glycosyltransferase involved in cell wall biosynthesis